MKTDLEDGSVAIRSAEVRRETIAAVESIDESYQSLAKLLHETYDNGYYIRWGFENFKEYCETEIGVQYRKARYLVGIAQMIKDLSIDWSEVEGIGWTKLRTLLPLLKDEGVGDWLELAKQYSVKELETLVRDHKDGFDISADGGDKIITLTFRMTPETSEIVTDALDTAKKAVETNDNVLALEQMCFDYVMQQGEVPEKTSLESLIKFAEVHYGVELVIEGREEIGEMLGDEDTIGVQENKVG